MSRELFAHHDAIASSRRGTILMVSEPTIVYLTPGGGKITLTPGTWLRVIGNAAGLVCEVALENKIKTIVVRTQDFTNLDFK